MLMSWSVFVRLKQGVALTGRNTTGPPWSVTNDDRRRQTAASKTILAPTHAPYTMCRRDSNKGTTYLLTYLLILHGNHL